MTKNEILEILNSLDLPPLSYIVKSDAAMVLQNIKKTTNQIKIATNEIINKQISNNINESIIFSPLSKNESFTLLDNIKVSTKEDLLKEKELEHNKKDYNAIELALCTEDNYRYERKLNEKGINLICGIDEVGRGPLVGPVVASAVILPKNYHLEGLTDSKKLSKKKREQFYDIIMKDAISVGIGVVDSFQIDEINIYEASRLAMEKALSNLKVTPEYILTDAMPLNVNIPTLPIIKGDIKSQTISAASVIAKVYRDDLMDKLHDSYPYYNFKKNKGYPTKEHIEAIKKYGIIKEHRKTYGPVRDYLLSTNKNN